MENFELWTTFLALTEMANFFRVHYNTNVLIWLKGVKSLNINAGSTTPIYIQIAEWLENEILANRLEADGKVYSQYQLAELFNINPATAGKGLTILVDNEILYKKRGLGMFVMENAKDKILATRRSETLTKMVRDVVVEARRLAVKDEELLALVMRVQREGE